MISGGQRPWPAGDHGAGVVGARARSDRAPGGRADTRARRPRRGPTHRRGRRGAWRPGARPWRSRALRPRAAPAAVTGATRARRSPWKRRPPIERERADPARTRRERRKDRGTHGSRARPFIRYPDASTSEAPTPPGRTHPTETTHRRGRSPGDLSAASSGTAGEGDRRLHVGAEHAGIRSSSLPGAHA